MAYQVYLPDGYAQALATPNGGTISGQNVSLDIDGQLRNSGQITAGDLLQVKAGSLDLSPNVVDIGTNAYKAQGGWNVVTGTVVQPGGFLSAMRMDIDAGMIHAVNDAFRITRADGTVDEEASAALVAQLKESLGLNYTEDTLQDDIHTRFIKEKKGFGIIGQIVAMVAAVAVSIITAGAAAAAMGVVLANMTLGQAMLVAALSSMASSMTSQLISGQGLNFGKIAQAGLVGAVTAGLTNGITFDGSSFGVSEWGQSLKGTSTLANLAGSTSVEGVVQAAQEGATGTIAQQVVGVVGTGVVNAGVSTAVYGGSFGEALKGNLIAQAGALSANSIGGAATPGSWQSVASHAALGCAAGAASGTGCEAGAIGGATSALLAPDIINLIDPSGAPLSPEQKALVTALAMIAGGGMAAVLGLDATSAAGAAQNEALNNATAGDHVQKAAQSGGVLGAIGGWISDTYSSPVGDIARWRDEFLGLLNSSGGQTSPADPNPLIEVNQDGNPPAAGGALVTPPLTACIPGGGCVVVVPAVVPGNAILSSGSGNGNGNGKEGTGSEPNGGTSVGNNGGLTTGDKIGILRDAATGKGNFSLGEATVAETNALGKDWVGPGYRVSQTDGTTLISADGLRQYRPPAPKSSSYATTGVQANFQSRSVPNGAWQNNGHMNVKGK